MNKHIIEAKLKCIFLSFLGVRQAGFNLPMQKQLFEMEKEAMKQKEAIKQKKAIKQNVSGKRQQNSQRKHGKNKSRLH